MPETNRVYLRLQSLERFMSLKRNLILFAAYMCALVFMSLPFAMIEAGEQNIAEGGQVAQVQSQTR